MAAGRWPLAAGRWLPCALIAAAIGVAPRDTLAQSTALYRIVHFPPQTTEVGAECRVLGLNDLGQAVGFTHELIGEDLVPRAFVWFPQDTTIDGVTYPTGMIHLLLEPGESLSNLLAHASVARSINEATQIAGAWSDGLAVGDFAIGEAFLWVPEAALASGSPPTNWPARVMEPFLSASGYDWSDAWDLSDPYEDAIVVVGAREDDGCQSGPGYRGFVWYSTTRLHDGLPGSGDLSNSFAAAVSPTATAPSGIQRPTGVIVNHCFHEDPCNLPPPSSPGGVPNTGKLYGDRAAAWTPSWTTTVLPQTVPAISPTYAWDPDGYGLDVIPDGRIVGGGHSATEEEWPGLSCRELPLHWATPTSAPDILPLPVDGFGVVDQGYANALNSISQVVGTNTTQTHAYLWEQGAATWTDYDLNGLVKIGAADCDWEQLYEAFDINEGVGGSAAWICGYGDFDYDNEAIDLHGFVLVPVGECDVDLDHDGSVGFGDLLILNAAWGSCPAYRVCWADLDADCAVGNSDLLLLLSSWGSSCGSEDAPMAGGAGSNDALFLVWLEEGGIDLVEAGDPEAIAWLGSLGSDPSVAQIIEGFALLSASDSDDAEEVIP